MISGLGNSAIPVGYINFVGAGEPLLHKQLEQLAQEAKNVVSDVRVTTNGILLTKETSEALISSGINFFSISITGSTIDVYRNFQGCGKDDESVKEQLETVVKNIQDLCEIRNKRYKNVVVLLSYILTEESKDHLFKYISFFRRLGVDEILARPLDAPPAECEGLYDKEYFTNKILALIEKKGCICSLIGRHIAVYSSGDVYPCCNWKPQELKLGNIYETPLIEMLNSEKLLDTIDRLHHSQEPLPECCKNCYQGLSI